MGWCVCVCVCVVLGSALKHGASRGEGVLSPRVLCHVCRAKSLMFLLFLPDATMSRCPRGILARTLGGEGREGWRRFQDAWEKDGWSNMVELRLVGCNKYLRDRQGSNLGRARGAPGAIRSCGPSRDIVWGTSEWGWATVIYSSQMQRWRPVICTGSVSMASIPGIQYIPHTTPLRNLTPPPPSSQVQL